MCLLKTMATTAVLSLLAATFLHILTTASVTVGVMGDVTSSIDIGFTVADRFSVTVGISAVLLLLLLLLSVLQLALPGV